MTVKTDYSRFDIHDELTAPEGSIPILKGVSTAGGSISKFVGVLAGAPAALRAFTRMRSELRAGVLPEPTRLRIALAVAERRNDDYSVAQYAGLARRSGLGIDEISRARSFSSADAREEALLAFLAATIETDGRPDKHLQEEAREVGWSDEEILEALAHVALNEFQSLVANAAELPREATDPENLPEAA
jgi:alkylhydroperoxidase family enzyme